MMSIILTILAGLVSGAIAKFIMPGKQGGGFIVTSILGILGALLGGFLFGGDLLGEFDPMSLVFSVLGAIIILFVYGLITKKK